MKKMNITAHKIRFDAPSGQDFVCVIGQAASARLGSDFAVLRLLP
jgi:hypothetical protein